MNSMRFIQERMIHTAATSLEAQWISPKRGKKLSSSLEPGASLREAYELQRRFASGGARLTPFPAPRPRLDATAFLEARRRTWLESRQAAAALSASNPSRRRGASPRDAEEEVCLADLCADPQYDAAILESIFGHEDVDRNPHAGIRQWRKASVSTHIVETTDWRPQRRQWPLKWMTGRHSCASMRGMCAHLRNIL